jgi:release factor glutamine methyltransferase
VIRPRTLLADAAARLRAAGVDSAEVDAQLLLAHSLGVDRSRLLIIDEVPAATARDFTALVERRLTREPVQHLLGVAPFRYLTLQVGPGVFVPRPETELLVDAVLPALHGASAPVVVDLCAGSGALALAVASEVPGAVVHAVERSPQALGWLRRNCARTDVQVHEADVTATDSLLELTGRVDVVLSNPPYVPRATEVSPEVRHDPEQAVFAGADGLELMPAVLGTAARLLRRGGVLALEHDESHAVALLELIGAGPWTRAHDHDDLTGRSRFVTVVRD